MGKRSQHHGGGQAASCLAHPRISHHQLLEDGRGRGAGEKVGRCNRLPAEAEWTRRPPALSEKMSEKKKWDATPLPAAAPLLVHTFPVLTQHGDAEGPDFCLYPCEMTA